VSSYSEYQWRKSNLSFTCINKKKNERDKNAAKVEKKKADFNKKWDL
jgi:hypothetical protein